MPNSYTKARESIAKALKIHSEEIESPDNPGFGDFSYPCFSLAKEQKKNPVEIAKSLVEKFSKKKIPGIIEIKSIGPYLNFYIDWKILGNEVLKNPIPKFSKNKKTIMVEFAHPNTHKGFHIGHTRNISIGGSLSRILETMGYKVIRANYQGDVGPHIAKCLWGYMNLKKLKLKEPKEEKGRWLGKVYSAASNYIEGKPDLEEEVKQLTLKMYANDIELMKWWEKTKAWSLQYFDYIYKDFGVKFDRLYMESEVHDTGIQYANDFLEKKIAKKSQGAVIVDLENKGLGVVVLLTKEGYPLYTAKELGLANLEFSEYSPDKIIHVVAVEQDLFFKQLSHLIGKLNPKWESNSHHLSYEMVSLKEGKMSSRTGTVVLYDELKEKLYQKTLAGINEKNPKLKNKEDVAKKLSQAALIYDMIKVNSNTRMIFDWEQALSLEGNTGPYLLYTYARASSILRKQSAPKSFDSSLLKEDVEQALIKLLARFPEVIEKSAKNYAPNILANHIYELANAFNTFYQTIPILKSDKEKSARLKLVDSTRTALKYGLNLLGIETVEEM